MPKQKKLSDLNFKLDVNQVLEILWKIRDNDKFYFIAYGKQMIENIIKQNTGK